MGLIHIFGIHCAEWTFNCLYSTTFLEFTIAYEQIDETITAVPVSQLAMILQVFNSLYVDYSFTTEMETCRCALVLDILKING